QPPHTWGDWTDAMTRVAARAAPGSWALLLPMREWQAPGILALQRGAGLLRDRDTRRDFQSAPLRHAFALYVRLSARGLAPRTGEAAVGTLYQDFASGYFSLYITGPWNLGEFARRLPPELQSSWSTAPMPTPDGEYPGVSLAGGASLAIHRGSAEK